LSLLFFSIPETLPTIPLPRQREFGRPPGDIVESSYLFFRSQTSSSITFQWLPASRILLRPALRDYGGQVALGCLIKPKVDPLYQKSNGTTIFQPNQIPIQKIYENAYRSHTISTGIKCQITYSIELRRKYIPREIAPPCHSEALTEESLFLT